MIKIMDTIFIYNHIRSINKKRIEFEQHILTIMNESDLVKIHKLESALIYFMRLFHGNNNIINSLTRELKDEIIFEKPTIKLWK